MPQRPRVGLFGGAFDPPHLAHRALVEAALAQLHLSRLIVLPTGDAWHKARTLSPAADRVAMCELAFAGLPHVTVDARETRRSGPSYTIDTLRELQAEQPDVDWVLIIGADQAVRFDTWREAVTIAKTAIISIAFRANDGLQAESFDAKTLSPALAQARILPLNLPAMSHSSTAVRAAVAAGQDVTPLVGPAVARYIATHHLYTSTE